VTPDRLRSIEELFHEARGKTGADRESLLEAACADDPAMRQELESLLNAAERGTALNEFDRLDSRLRANLGRLLDVTWPAGAQVGAYHIERLVGSGGMGRVYAATDSRLHRTVAIKVLLPEWSADAAFRARFEREARILASVNHPGIAAIYDIDSFKGVLALVLEFVDGPTLADRLARVRRIALLEALGIARQIASALEAAHERGIVHRDLKPSNIKITPEGNVKLLDFGIAWIAQPAAESHHTDSGTAPGHILGTASYMSPEQARGQLVDKRSDIWAFGCVLYELLTGRKAFAGDTASDTIAKVIERSPDWTALPADVPASMRRLLRRCLEKDPAERLHDVADARLEIADVLSTPHRDSDVIVRSHARWGAMLAAVFIAVLLGSAVALWVRGAGVRSSPVAGGPVMEFGITFPNNFMPADGIALSPDGRRIAVDVWSNSGNIWVYTFDGSQPRPLTDSGLANYPFWSPDNATLGFFQGGRIVTMSSTGGSATPVASVPAGAAAGPTAAGGATWNRGNVIVFSNGSRLFRVPASGSSPPVEIALSGIAGKLRTPAFLPDGRHFTFCEQTGTMALRYGTGSLKLGSLDGGEVTNLGGSDCPGGTFALPDQVLFLRGGSLFAQRLDLRRLEVASEPRLVAAGVHRGAVGPWPALTVSASDSGAIAIPAPRGGSSLGVLTWFNRQGQVVGTIPTGDAAAENLNAQVSPTNDSLVAVNRQDLQTGAWHIWLIDTSRNNAATRLTSDVATDVDPVWSPDGANILYTSDRNGTPAFYRQAIHGGSPERLLDVSTLDDPMASDWSTNGSVLFQQLQRSVWTFRFGEQPATRLLEQYPYVYGARLSPDAKWLAYAAAVGTRFELFVERFPQGSPRKQISTNGGVHARWTKGGKELVYWASPGGIVATDLQLTDSDIVASPAHTLVERSVLGLVDARTHFDITRDGEKILMRQAAGPPTPGIRVIVNWMSGDPDGRSRN
jgi:Tol biopolymer transport system component